MNNDFRKLGKRCGLFLLGAAFLIPPAQVRAQNARPSFDQLLRSRIESKGSISFKYSPTHPKPGQLVQFTPNSASTVTSVHWDFGDGTDSTELNPSHTFGAVGFYRVAMTAANRLGSATVSQTVSVLGSKLSASSTPVAPPVTSFSYNPASPVLGQAVQFTDTSTGSPTSWQWSFGDGSISSAENPTHAYTAAGSYTASLTASNSGGSKAASQTVTVTTPLTASFAFTPSSPLAGQAVQFTDMSTGTPTSWQWGFGDGATSTVQNPSHTYTAPGSYTVSLTATNSAGSKTANKTVTVVAAATASFTFTPTSPVAGQTVQFTDTSTGSPTSWQWSFGDGSISTAQDPSHAFAGVGSYTVTLMISNGSASKSTSASINILPASSLTASFSYTPSNPTTSQSIIFTDTSTGTPTSWQWDFGDGTGSTSENPSHAYASAAPYTVTLTIQSGSSSASASQTITVKQANSLTAASASLSDVKSAVSSATYGDTVYVPAGSATWNGSVTVTKGISIIGAGAGVTNITAGSTDVFIFTPDTTTRANQNEFRISGFTFSGSPSRVIYLSESNSQTIPIRNVRIDHNQWENSAGYPMYIDGNFWGCVDNNDFAGANFFMILGNQDTDWKEFFPVSYGTADNLYFEDNTFEGSSPFGIQSGQGGRWAFRYNTVTTPAMENPMFDQHGDQSGGIYALMLCEIYGNAFKNMATDVNRWDYQRGGKLLMYNNIGTSNTDAPDITVNDDWYSSSSPGTEYPYEDYFFNNLWNGSRVDAVRGADVANHEAENVTFFNQTDSFNGTAGIGVGPLSSRPATCSTEGVAWWATDLNQLYRWHSGAWQLYYTPYTYPHPLRKET